MTTRSRRRERRRPIRGIVHRSPPRVLLVRRRASGADRARAHLAARRRPAVPVVRVLPRLPAVAGRRGARPTRLAARQHPVGGPVRQRRPHGVEHAVRTHPGADRVRHPRSALAKLTLAASLGWVLVVWWFDEAFGMLFVNMAQPLTGAPGACSCTGSSPSSWPTGRPTGRFGARGAKTMWRALWIVMAWLWLLPASGSAHRTAAALTRHVSFHLMVELNDARQAVERSGNGGVVAQDPDPAGITTSSSPRWLSESSRPRNSAKTSGRAVVRAVAPDAPLAAAAVPPSGRSRPSVGASRGADQRPGDRRRRGPADPLRSSPREAGTRESPGSWPPRAPPRRTRRASPPAARSGASS